MFMKIIYFSASGNTEAFVNKLKDYGDQQHQVDSTKQTIELMRIEDESSFNTIKEPFVAFVPTYLDGGNGLDNGTQEIITNVLGEFIEYKDNSKRLLGVVGSGNRNFNWQYCLTAKQYAQKFSVPFLADYELRGTQADCDKIYTILQKVFSK